MMRTEGASQCEHEVWVYLLALLLMLPMLRKELVYKHTHESDKYSRAVTGVQVSAPRTHEVLLPECNISPYSVVFEQFLLRPHRIRGKSHARTNDV